jgi:hypothetical protein
MNWKPLTGLGIGLSVGALFAAVFVPAIAQSSGPVLYGCDYQGGTGRSHETLFDVGLTPPACPAGSAQQSSGTIDIKAGLDWLVAGGFIPGPEVVSQMNTGWEITSADNATFTMNSYSITASP